MIIAHPGNVATLVPPPSNPHTNASTIPKVGDYGVPTQLMCVIFTKLGSESEDQSEENSILLFI